MWKSTGYIFSLCQPEKQVKSNEKIHILKESQTAMPLTITSSSICLYEHERERSGIAFLWESKWHLLLWYQIQHWQPPAPLWFRAWRLASDFLAPAGPQRCLTDVDRKMRIAYLTLLCIFSIGVLHLPHENRGDSRSCLRLQYFTYIQLIFLICS